MKLDLLHRDEGTILLTKRFELAWRGLYSGIGFVDARDYFECMFQKAYIVGPFVVFWKRKP